MDSVRMCFHQVYLMSAHTIQRLTSSKVNESLPKSTNDYGDALTKVYVLLQTQET